MLQRSDVVIVGAGLAGSLAAALLARNDAGTSVTLLERRQVSVAAEGRHMGLLMNTRGSDALQAAGIEIEHQMLGAPLIGRVRVSPQGVSSVSTWPQSMFATDRRRLNEAILEAALRHPKVQLVNDCSVDSVSPNGVVGGRYQAKRWLLGADGRNSIVRRCLFGGRLSRAHYSWCSIGFEAAQLSRQHITMFPSGDSRAFLHCMPSHRGPTWFSGTLVLPNSHLKEARGDPAKYFRSTLPHALAAVGERALLDLWESAECEPLSTVHVERFVRGNQVALIGDAAHGVVPFAGQGMNAALEDALLISAGGASLQEYEASRLPEMRAMQRISLEAFSAVASCSESGYHRPEVFNYVNFQRGKYTVAEQMMKAAAAAALQKGEL